MRKIKRTCICVMVLLFGFLGSVQVFATTEDNAQVKATEAHGRGHFKHDPEFIKKQAESLGIDIGSLEKEVRDTVIKNEAKELGISIEGKELYDLANEVRETHIKKVAKDLGISTNGKELKDLVHEIREIQIKKDAKELGISIENKNLRKVAHEVREKRIFQAAKKLGIETKNKSANEVFKEIITNHADKVKELNLFPTKEGKIFFFDRSKEN
ncbi:cell division protein FtsL [Neobacillus sp. B4I6]|uniref:hypothetical protein n=1 Tax=Neobacillus sp. B4I6 TaxID=3373925 RepID=UPI003D1E423E